jgi:hypothetical protein
VTSVNRIAVPGVTLVSNSYVKVLCRRVAQQCHVLRVQAIGL